MLMVNEQDRTVSALAPLVKPDDVAPNHDTRTWYVLLIEPQQEVRVYTQLKSYQLNVYLPLVPNFTTRGVRRTKVKVYRPMMRGYLFVDEASLDDDGRWHIDHQPAIHRFMRVGDRLATIPEKQMNRVRAIEIELQKPKPIQSIWSVGEVVRVSDGPFWGINVEITDLADGQRIRVDVALMGRKVPTFIDSSSLEKL